MKFGGLEVPQKKKVETSIVGVPVHQKTPSPAPTATPDL
jgi:hypothetical protein